MLRLPRVPRAPRVSLKLLLALALAAVACFGGWMWLRDSSLVRVDTVKISGANGFGSPAVRSALDAAARDMTTLNYDEAALRAAVARYPLVKTVTAQADLLHTLRIVVHERTPVGVIEAGSSQVAVAEDGTLLREVPVSGLPAIITKVPPGGNRVGDRKTQAKVDLLAAAPRSLRRRVTRVTLGGHGLTAFLVTGPQLRFGDGRRLHAKWIAAQRVMADPGAASATYIDVRVPERPAAGGLTLEQGGAPQSLTASSADPASVAATDTGAPADPQNPATDPAADPSGDPAADPAAAATGTTP